MYDDRKFGLQDAKLFLSAILSLEVYCVKKLSMNTFKTIL